MNISENGGADAPLFEIGGRTHLQPYQNNDRWHLRVEEGPWKVASLQDIDQLIQGYASDMMERFFELKTSNQKDFIQFRRAFDQQFTETLNHFEVYVPCKNSRFFHVFDRDRAYMARHVATINDFAVRLLCNVRLLSNIRQSLLLCEEGQMKSALVEAFLLCDDFPETRLFDYKSPGDSCLESRWDEESRWLRTIDRSLRGHRLFSIENRENILRTINEWLASDDSADQAKLRSDLKKVLRDNGAFYFTGTEASFDELFRDWWKHLHMPMDKMGDLVDRFSCLYPGEALAPLLGAATLE